MRKSKIVNELEEASLAQDLQLNRTEPLRILPPSHTNVDGHGDIRRRSDSIAGNMQGTFPPQLIYLDRDEGKAKRDFQSTC